MGTTFKIGDRVRLTGEAWERHGIRYSVVTVKLLDKYGDPAFIDIDNGMMSIFQDKGEDWSATLVEPAPPPPDTRKRLREYTDLCDDDVVVIAGFPMTVANNGNIVRGNQCDYKVNGHSPVADMLVDEILRKPRTKKRRVYEEVDKGSERDGDLLVYDDGSFTTVYRLVEETEVPR